MALPLGGLTVAELPSGVMIAATSLVSTATSICVMLVTSKWFVGMERVDHPWAKVGCESNGNGPTPLGPTERGVTCAKALIANKQALAANPAGQLPIIPNPSLLATIRPVFICCMLKLKFL